VTAQISGCQAAQSAWESRDLDLPGVVVRTLSARGIRKLASTWQINMMADSFGSIADHYAIINHALAGTSPEKPEPAPTGSDST
jgi:hypothetical protein